MLNPEQKLNQKLFDADVEQLPIRQGYGEGLVQAGTEDENVVALCADLTESSKTDLFKKKFPTRFVEIGIGEQNLASVASGMAHMGKIPFISSYAMFSPGRNWEQIRTTVAYNHVPVKIAGSHAGVSVGPDGGTHQAIEDIAIMRVIPRMIVISPCDAIEARKATIAAAKNNEPVYIRLAREKTPVITTEETPFEIGKAQVFYTSENFDKAETAKKIGIVATGALLFNAIAAAKMLEVEGISSKVINIATIKPLDEKAIIALAKECGALVTVEEHQIAGGMGSAVAECLSQNHPTIQEFIGVKDLFGQSGTPEELIIHYGMDSLSIQKAVRAALARKNLV